MERTPELVPTQPKAIPFHLQWAFEVDMEAVAAAVVGDTFLTTMGQDKASSWEVEAMPVEVSFRDMRDKEVAAAREAMVASLATTASLGMAQDRC